MLKKFEKYLQTQCHCSKEKNFLLGVSGGIDSSVMCELFFQSGIPFGIAHCNFKLRGNDADDDQKFVEHMAKRMNAPSHVINFKTKDFASGKGISIQMAARELRYSWFEKIKEENQYDYIAIAHNKNDIVETVLLNLSRGTGIRGLTGIKPRQGNIVRPLLFASREEILQFANEHKITWCNDSSNSETKYLRNKIRHEIIPLFKMLNPVFMQSAIESISYLQQAEILLNFALQTIKKEVRIELNDRILIDIEKLLQYPATETVLFELLRDFNCNSSTVKSIVASFNGIPGKQFITRTHLITHDRSHLIITQNLPPVDDEIYIDPETAIITYPIHLVFKSYSVDKNFAIPSERSVAAIDRDKLTFPLKLRLWKHGDIFHPLGMEGSQKISDFLINNKISLPDKKNVWVIESAGEIVWVTGLRLDDRFKINTDTNRVLLVEYKIDTEK